MIIVLDFGSQYAQMISRRLREIGCFNLLVPWSSKASEIRGYEPKGVIISGGPNSIHADNSKNIDNEIFNLGIPILGICYGMQYIASFYGGKVSSSQYSEYGRATLKVLEPNVLFEGVELDGDCTEVWMSHSDSVDCIPNGFVVTAKTENCLYAAFANEKLSIYGLQFHPEVNDTSYGREILRNFVTNVCQDACDWQSNVVLDKVVSDIKLQITQDRVILALSGGVDSMVLAHVFKMAIPRNNLYCVLVDHGMLRDKEVQQVVNTCEKADIKLHVINAKNKFLSEIKGINEPELKRKTIGRLFVEEFEKYAKTLSKITWLAQGTIYPDVIESAGNGDAAKVIKSHHNVGGLPEKLGLNVIEPFRELYKDEVRAIGKEMGLPSEIIDRHPFPGPGLAIRILGEITEEKISILQEVDQIWIEELRENNLYEKISQAFAVLLPVNSVGVVGDNRNYGPVVALRAVVTDDFMTAKWARIDPDLLDKAATRIINEVPRISRVVYDISSKPPATIEWE